jgi:hypothetical protein
MLESLLVALVSIRVLIALLQPLPAPLVIQHFIVYSPPSPVPASIIISKTHLSFVNYVIQHAPRALPRHNSLV